MTTTTALDRQSVRNDGHALVPPLIEAIGQEGFGPSLANYLHALCGAERFAAFHLEGDTPHPVVASCVHPGRTADEVIERYVHGGLWKGDMVMNEARRSVGGCVPSVVHADFSDRRIQDQASRLFPQVSDRIVLCGRSRGKSFSLSMLRTGFQSTFSNEAVNRFISVAELVVALLAKHVAVAQSLQSTQALTSLPVIEACITGTGALPRREGEVCARVLYGLSSAGTALALGLSEETVRTYRKRAYQRLAIGSERELLNWYLERWQHRGAQRLCS